MLILNGGGFGNPPNSAPNIQRSGVIKELGAEKS